MRSPYELFTVSILLAGCVSAKDQICRALALSGGGSKGAWEAGIIYGLMHSGRPEDFVYDVVSGVSAGSINAGGMSVWPKGQEVEMSEWLGKQWESLTTDQIYKEWRGGYATGILVKPSLYDTSPGLQFLTDLLGEFTDKGYELPTREIVVSAMNADTGVYTQFDNSQPLNQWPRSILASASVPFAFPPTEVDGQIYMDGMTAWNTNLASAVQKCYDQVGDYSKITIDIANCDYYSLKQIQETSENALSNYMRGLDISRKRSHTNDILEFKRAYPEVNFRYYFAPSGEVVSGMQELNFDNSTTYFMQTMGREDAQTAINTQEGVGFNLLQDYQEDEELQNQHENFMDYFLSMKNLFYH